LIEKKATGISLIQDLRRASPGRVRAYNPGKGEDKVSRAHSVSPLFQSGVVHVPNRAWALGSVEKKITGLVEYVAMFPAGSAPVPDITDTCTQALIFMRSNNWLSDHESDKQLPYDNRDTRSEEEREDDKKGKVRRFYT
jgi:phage terminase large subunit-like protein